VLNKYEKQKHLNDLNMRGLALLKIEF